jgi:transcriptional regulator with XRE-family HTH domain
MAALTDRIGGMGEARPRLDLRRSAKRSGSLRVDGAEGLEGDAGMDESFGPVLRCFRQRAGISQNALAKVAALDASYVHRLESGERGTPTRPVVDALAQALTLAPEERDQLLFAAGYVPPSLQRLGPRDPTLAAVVRQLTDERLSPASRADFRAVVETIAARWQ